MPENEPLVLDTAKREPTFDLARSLAVVRKKTGKSAASQAAEIVRLGLGHNRITPSEYYYYCLFDDQRFTLQDKTEFLGMRAQQKIIRQCNPIIWWGLAHDKLLCHALLEGLGLPTPRILAISHPCRSFGNVPVLRDAASLSGFLRGSMPYPFFAKPVSGMYSVGVALVLSYSPDTDCVTFFDGRKVELDKVAAAIFGQGGDGYIFQERLTPHSILREVCGEAVSTLRMVVILTDKGPELFRVVWKVIAGGNVADNFWRPGNLLAAVDPETGVVKRVVRGVGPEQQELESHPDSGRPLLNMVLPLWEDAKALCLRSAEAVPGLRLQAWDVALCENGPVLVELNVGGDFNLPQTAHGRGLLDARTRAFLDTCVTSSTA
jgi:glutathione synthase/RimK-type ligase-like ATP-grasp enzyme